MSANCDRTILRQVKDLGGRSGEMADASTFAKATVDVGEL
jgi:hypothetical protein